MIRPYQPSDKPKIIELCREFWESACSAEFGDFCEVHTGDKLEQILHCGACIVTDNVDGFILLCETTNLCNPSPIAAEVAWYVSPSARGGAGARLLKAAIDYCKVKNIYALSMMYIQSSMPESIAKIYDKLGFSLQETTYVKRI